VWSPTSSARRTLFSGLLDIVRVREGNSDQPPAAVVQTVEQKYGMRKGGRSSDSGLLDLPPGLTLRTAVSPPSGLRPEVVVHRDSNDIASR
jgi:hypothetical protein